MNADNGIIYTLGGGTLAIGSPTEYTKKTVAQTVVLLDPTPANAYTYFMGWQLTSAPSGVTLAGDTLYIPANVSGAIRLTAIWRSYGINRDDHVSYVNGYSDNTFRPDSPITRAEAATVLFRLTIDSTKNASRASRFTDVKAGDWYAQAVNYMASIEVAAGYTDGTFKPDQYISRKELTVLVTRWLAVQIETSTTSPFVDLSKTDYAYNYVVTFYNNGWITGYPDGTFKPNQNITRAEFVTIINRILKRSVRLSDVSTTYRNLYSDVNPTYWAFTDIIEGSVSHRHTYNSSGVEIWY
ncbi:MAG: S-layer homology domain-containing protein [Oscillospiraceae bacterium]|nr:S-layer homology domain-containing protein [Oscillospiraceae bacterium]